ncbi:MAG: hypothetical protein COB50_03495 [Thiotrichales bacterium]|nr:MAG: hypothetical protein COB50_03495 [Thiotrichales bacterium]
MILKPMKYLFTLITISMLFIANISMAHATSMDPKPILNKILNTPEQRLTYAVSVSFGAGKPDSLRGGRISFRWHPKQLVWKYLSIYMDTSFAQWRNNFKHNKNLSIFAIAPVFRVNITSYNSSILPYLEGSVGLSIMTKHYIGHRNLGSRFAFQDLMGFGVLFGKRHQFSLSYHFLHYSNASIWPPNEGIDVKYLITFAYRF